MEEASWRHLGGIWEASGRLLEASGRRLGALGRSGVSWGVSAHKCSPLSVRLRFFTKSIKKTKRFGGRCHQVLRMAANLDPHSPARRPVPNTSPLPNPPEPL